MTAAPGQPSKPWNFIAAVPAKGRLDLGSLEAPSSSERDSSKFGIRVSLIGKCALFLLYPRVRHGWLGGTAEWPCGQGRAQHSTLMPGLGVGADPAGLVGQWLGPWGFSLRPSGASNSTSAGSPKQSCMIYPGQGTDSGNGVMGSDTR